MTELTASRTLVKSPPELWAECSDAASLSRHLDRFGQIRITRLEPETVVAWEGESASGTVRLEPSGWGTKVVLTAQPERELAPPEADLPAPVEADPQPPAKEPDPVDETPPPATEEPRPGPFARLLGLLRRRHAVAPQGEPAVAHDTEPVVAPEAEASVVVEPGPDEPPAVGESAAPVEPPSAVALELMALEQALDSLGQAHHRPFSRA